MSVRCSTIEYYALQFSAGIVNVMIERAKFSHALLYATNVDVLDLRQASTLIYTALYIHRIDNKHTSLAWHTFFRWQSIECAALNMQIIEYEVQKLRRRITHGMVWYGME